MTLQDVDISGDEVDSLAREVHAPSRNTDAGQRQRRINLWKATPAIALSVATLLLVAGLSLAIFTDRASKTQKMDEIRVQGQILASTVSAALSFEDHAAAQEYVNALSVNPEILTAALYDSTGQLFAGYVRSEAGAPPARLESHSSSYKDYILTIVTPVAEGKTVSGWVYLQAITESTQRRIARVGIIALLTTMAAIVVTVLGVAHSTLSRANAHLEDRTLALAAANQRLQQQIEQREKAEAALRQAQKMEAIGHLTGGVAHDFNNLLQIILTSLDMLKRRAETWTLTHQASADFRRFMEAAVTGGERAASLTRQLLAFARRQPLEPKETDVNKLVLGMSDLLRRTLGESVSVETVLGGGVWRIFADANQLESALLNLAVNARDAMDGSGKLTIETANAHLDNGYVRSHDDVVPGQYVLIAITDTGCGMTSEVLANAFEPFFTTKGIGHGTGLGLSQVYGFVKQSGGHVKIYSEPGKGTSVKLYLPRHTNSTAEPAATPDDRPVLLGANAETILVVEDEDSVRAFTVEMLRELGYKVAEAASGPAALRVLESLPEIQLLFTDVGLPEGLDGRQLADKALIRRPDLKVLFTSGYTRDAIVHAGRLDAGVALIGKPFTYAALADKVRKVLDGETG
jgi:signal transduction histidine kinase